MRGLLESVYALFTSSHASHVIIRIGYLCSYKKKRKEKKPKGEFEALVFCCIIFRPIIALGNRKEEGGGKEERRRKFGKDGDPGKRVNAGRGRQGNRHRHPRPPGRRAGHRLQRVRRQVRDGVRRRQDPRLQPPQGRYLAHVRPLGGSRGRDLRGRFFFVFFFLPFSLGAGL